MPSAPLRRADQPESGRASKENLDVWKSDPGSSLAVAYIEVLGIGLPAFKASRLFLVSRSYLIPSSCVFRSISPISSHSTHEVSIVCDPLCASVCLFFALLSSLPYWLGLSPSSLLLLLFSPLRPFPRYHVVSSPSLLRPPPTLLFPVFLFFPRSSLLSSF